MINAGLNTSKQHKALYSQPNIDQLTVTNFNFTKNKTTVLTDFIASQNLDIMAITETWLTGNDRDDRTLADIANTLNDYDIAYTPSANSTGGGVAVIFRKGITVTQNVNDSLFTSIECLDLKISLGSKLLRFITIYRPPPSDRFLITGDFNFTLVQQIMMLCDSST